MQSEPRSFFFDENISEHLAQIVARFDRNNLIISHAEKFDKGTPDTVWIPEVASWSPKPVVVLGDGRVMRRSAEKLGPLNNLAQPSKDEPVEVYGGMGLPEEE